MAKPISINKIRQRKKSQDAKDRCGKDYASPASPFSYIILLDEDDQAAANPPAKGISKHRHSKD
jgi:hypothetical protein